MPFMASTVECTFPLFRSSACGTWEARHEGRILEVTELHQLQVEIARLHILAHLETCQAPSLNIVF